MDTTITILVSIATGNKYEGNAVMTINLPDYHLHILNTEKVAQDVKPIIQQEISDYFKNNRRTEHTTL